MVLIGAYIALTLTVSEVLSLQVCGKNLADMLDLVCDGRGFHWTSTNSVPRINKRTALQYLNAFSESSSSGRQTGVVNECCKRPCTISHLESYCAAGPGTYLPNPTSGPLPQESLHLLFSGMRGSIPTATTTTVVIPQSTTPAPTVPSRSTLRPSPMYMCRRVVNGVRMPCFRSSFFFVRPVGPRPTRVPVL